MKWKVADIDFPCRRYKFLDICSVVPYFICVSLAHIAPFWWYVRICNDNDASADYSINNEETKNKIL